MKTTWEEYRNIEEFPSLTKSASPDVVIVGGGMAGLLSAYLISKEGKKVIILEKGRIAAGVTMYTTAFLTHSLDTDYTDLIKIYGNKNAKTIIDSHRKAIDLIEQIVRDERIDCDFTRCSNYIYANSKKDTKGFEDELNAIKELGGKGKIIQQVNDLGFKNAGYLEIQNQAKFNPLKFVSALLKTLKKMGVKIYENTEVVKVGSDGDTGEVETKSKIILLPKWVIVATYEPLDQPLRLFFKKGLYVSYVLEAELKNIKIKEGTYEDTYNPYHYFRIDEVNGTQRLIAGGEDHRQEIKMAESKNFNSLKEYLDKTIGKENYKVTKKWRGPILEPVDGIAHIGRLDPENVLYAMSFSGNGMTYSGISAIIFSDIISGRKSKYERIYSPKRIPNFQSLLTKGKDYGEEFVKGALKNIVIQRKR
ncbi:MAG: FAD-dependent oxidoreductase [Candidatus Nomurabacteria bacterium]|nr:FAD-dependent oxidoreductase [Candidatus Nomurabacteria bacterium]